MKNNAWVCGMGVNTAIGMTVQENLQSLLALQSGVSMPTILNTLHKDEFPVCEIKKTNEELAALANMPADFPRATYFSALAAKEATSHLPFLLKDYNTGFISANTVGGMDKTEDFFKDYLQNPSHGHLKDVQYHECGSITDLVATELGITHHISTISTACSSSANAIMQGSRLIKHGLLDCCIVGGTDALTKFTLNGFNTLLILDKSACKPFDANRNGLNLGEGAAYLVLVNDTIKEKYNLKAIAKVSGYANANDAYHQTASSAEGHGNFLAMQQALSMSTLLPSDISYINAHGTGTANNDSSEGIAIQRLFENTIPPLSSTKAYTGHTLGACGSIEAVYCILAMQHGVLFPTLRFETQIPEHHFSPIKEVMHHVEIKHTMSNSFGFGGNCSSIIFSKA
ncbi:MAG: beta-ketoacyl-[acyl-carrier-protein] synthase family protein [Chitinophagaceae bacterium]